MDVMYEVYEQVERDGKLRLNKIFNLNTDKVLQVGNYIQGMSLDWYKVQAIIIRRNTNDAAIVYGLKGTVYPDLI